MPKRIDANQNEIVAVLRKCGASVLILSEVGKGCPDLLVGHRGINHLVELKDGKKPKSQQKLTDCEDKFFKTWQGTVRVINTVEQALELIQGAL